MTTTTTEPVTLYATPPADWLDHDDTDMCVNCGEYLCLNFEGRKGQWGHSRTADTVCRPPLPGQRVRVLADVTTREPGDDTGHEIAVTAGQLGTVEGFVPAWYDADVMLDDGRNVWLSPDNIEPVTD